MYADEPTTMPDRISVPAPTRENPAGGTTGVPAGQEAPVRSGMMGVPTSVLAWAGLGLAVVFGVRGVFRNGGVA